MEYDAVVLEDCVDYRSVLLKEFGCFDILIFL